MPAVKTPKFKFTLSKKYSSNEIHDIVKKISKEASLKLPKVDYRRGCVTITAETEEDEAQWKIYLSP